MACTWQAVHMIMTLYGYDIDNIDTINSSTAAISAGTHVRQNLQHQNDNAVVDSQGVSEKEVGDHIGGINVSSAVKGPVRGAGRGSSPWPGMASCCCRTEGDILATLSP